MYLSNCLSIYLSIYLSYLILSFPIPSHPILSYPILAYPIYPSVHLSVCLSVCLFVCLSFYLSICLSFCLSVFMSFYSSLYLFNLSTYLFVNLSICLSICLWFYLSIFFKCICLSMDLSFYLKERNYATRASKVEVNMPKSKYFCKTSSKNESSELWNDKILRDFHTFWSWQHQKGNNSARLPSKWKVDCRADGLVPMRFAIFPFHY